MCKISSWFGGSSKKKKAAQAAAAKAKQEQEAAARRAQAQGAMTQETATNAQTNKSENKTITSLRVPLQTAGTGGNVGYNNRYGLNLF